ncbi:ABC transporter substrate-binding protein [Chachezhania antarctica]|uniref:ABC transporter substrate-binding protein n=1 Tax=Chachezhania antarctica TaxID=2340860 RepID=UPI001F08A605|nr:ABC transporter substrate-binding protein [Chachezhania antarctica]|tara:strand:- start:10184 stop:11215 length:1032 start_codon:yes stop_codon:yes gene_type:complete
MFNAISRRGLMAGAKGMALAAVATLTAVPVFAQDKVTLGALRFTSHGAGFVALEKGYFAEEGLDVDLEFFQSAQPIAVATASGDVDFGVTGVTGGLMNLAEKDAIRIVGGVLHEKAGYDGMMILASNKAYDAGLTSVDDIPGHSVAMTQVGSTFHYMTHLIAEDKGWNMDDIRLVPLQKVGSMVAALKSGQVDVMIMVPHIAKALVEAGAAKELGWLNESAEYQISTIITSVENIEENRDMVERFLRAYGKGIADMNRVMLSDDADPAEKEEITKMIHKYVYADRPYEKAAPSIQAGAMFLNDGAAVNKTDIAEQMQWFTEEGLVDSDLTVDQLVDTSFVQSY